MFDVEHRERTTETEPDREAQREIEDLLVRVLRVQAIEELVFDALVVDREALESLVADGLARVDGELARLP